jgi:hypothetical protein
MPEAEGFNLYQDFARVIEYLTGRFNELRQIDTTDPSKHWQNQQKAISALVLGDLQTRHYLFRNVYIFHSDADMHRILQEQEASGEGNERFHGFSIIPHAFEIVSSIVRDGYVHLHHAVEDMFRYFNAHALNEPYGLIGGRPPDPINFIEVLHREFGFDLTIEYPRGGTQRGNPLPELFQKMYPPLDKIRLISNCVKHQGGVPNRTRNRALLALLPNLPERQKIVIDPHVFLEDFEYVVQFVAQFLNFYEDLVQYVVLQRELANGVTQPDQVAAQQRFDRLQLSMQTYARMFGNGEFGEMVTHMQDYVSGRRKLTDGDMDLSGPPSPEPLPEESIPPALRNTESEDGTSEDE